MSNVNIAIFVHAITFVRLSVVTGMKLPIDFYSFLNDTAYREAIENSSNYNSRLCRERRLRMPFLDSQTGKIMPMIDNKE